MRLIFIFLGIVAGLSAHAQDSLTHYLMLAAKNNPAVKQRFLEYQAALQRIPQAGGLPDPELSMGVFLSPMELVGGNQVADFRLMQMFPWFGTLRNAKDEMSQMAKARYEAFRDARLQVFFDVQKTWNELYKLQQEIRISEKNIELLRTIERLSLVKFRSGPSGGSTGSSSGASMPAGESQAASGMPPGMQSVGVSSGTAPGGSGIQVTSSMQGNSMISAAGSFGLADLYRVQIEMGELENNIALLRSQQKTMIAQFNSYLNRTALATVFLPDTLTPDTLDLTLQLVEDSMLSRNPMLGMLHYEGQSLDSRKKMVTRMGYPMIGLGLNYSLIQEDQMSASEMNGKDMIMPMVSVSLPIYRKKYKAMRLETDYLKTATEHSYSAAENNLITEYYQAVQLYEDARRRVKLFASQNALAAKTLDIMLKSFATSGSGLTEILRIRQQTLDYDYKHVEAVTDCNIAVAWLRKLGNLEF